LKPKAFIIEKFLDTAFRRPIRFRQKVLMVFSELRWNYSPLKEKAVLLPDGLFILLVASRQTAKEFFQLVSVLLLKQQARPLCVWCSTPLEIVEPEKKFTARPAASAATGLAAISFSTKFVASLESTP